MSKIKHIISGGKFAGKKMSELLKEIKQKKKSGYYLKGKGYVKTRKKDPKFASANYKRALESNKALRRYAIRAEDSKTVIPIRKQTQVGSSFQTHRVRTRMGRVAAGSESKINFKPFPTMERMFKKDIQRGSLQDFADTKKYLKNTLSDVKKKKTGGILKFKRGGDNMPKRNKKNFRPTEKGAGMTKAGVAAYRRANPGSKAAKRRKSFCARSAGQMKKFPKAAANPNSRLRQARRRWKC